MANTNPGEVQKPEDINARQGKAFDLAAEVVKQLLTLATGVMAVTITFAKDILGPAAGSPKAVLTGAWVLLVLSLLIGVMSLMTQAGQLGNLEEIPRPTVYSGNIRLFMTIQVLLFLGGVIAILIATVMSLK